MQIIRRNILSILATLAVIAIAGPPAALDSAFGQAGGRQVPFRSAPSHRIASRSPVYNLQLNEHPVMPALRWARSSVRYIESEIQDYSCTFAKRERINGKLTPYKYMQLKVRHRPFSVYVHIDSPASERGKEAIYVDGRANGKMMVHGVGLTGLLGTVTMDPRSPMAMKGNTHPITDIGILNMTYRLIKAGENDCQFGECEVKFIHGAKVNGRLCTCMQFVHPVPRREFRFHLVRVFVDKKLKLPIRFETYDWPKQRGGAPVLTGEYTYMYLKINNGFTDRDFDVRNPRYGFGR